MGDAGKKKFSILTFISFDFLVVFSWVGLRRSGGGDGYGRGFEDAGEEDGGSRRGYGAEDTGEGKRGD